MTPDAVDDEHDIVAQWRAMAMHSARRADTAAIPLPPLQPTRERTVPVIATIAAAVCLSVCGVLLAIANAAHLL